jgi:hypothetical protein
VVLAQHTATLKEIIRGEAKDDRAMHVASIHVAGQLVFAWDGSVSGYERLQAREGVDGPFAVVGRVPLGEEPVALCKHGRAGAGHGNVRHGSGFHLRLHVHVAAVGPLDAAVVDHLNRGACSAGAQPHSAKQRESARLSRPA